MRTSKFFALGLMAAIVAGVNTVSASEEKLDAPAVAAGCARQFERAQRVDMESFRDYDAATFKAGHHPDAVTVFASGAVRYGIDVGRVSRPCWRETRERGVIAKVRASAVADRSPGI